MTETVLVTGGTGFVAGWTIVELLRRGYGVQGHAAALGPHSGVQHGKGPAAARLRPRPAADTVADCGASQSE